MALLEILMQHAATVPGAWHRATTLARMLNIPRQTAQDDLRVLVDTGLIERRLVTPEGAEAHPYYAYRFSYAPKSTLDTSQRCEHDPSA